MTIPVTIHLPLANLLALARAAKECAEDLEADIDARYPARAEQPVQARRHERDMSPVKRAKEALSALPSNILKEIEP
jgi:hypothetical protein